MLRLAEDDRFVEGVAGEPDYEEPVLRKAHHILTSKQLGEYEHAARLDKLIAQVRPHRGLQLKQHSRLWSSALDRHCMRDVSNLWLRTCFTCCFKYALLTQHRIFQHSWQQSQAT